MKDTSKDIRAYHDEKVNLTSAQIKSMREKRDANWNKLKNGLSANGDPKPHTQEGQGSYQMRTMVQTHDHDYDIDYGVYFYQSDLGNKSAYDVRNMICAAVKDSSLKNPPEVGKHCVKIPYNDGSHIDIPAYRTDDNGDNPELASTNWKRSDAREVTDWFIAEKKSQSPDKEQMRRIVRLVKSFARSRNAWRGKVLDGFPITVLVVECYHPDLNRDDVSLYYTLKNMCDRLSYNLQIKHPVTMGDLLADHGDAKAKKFLDELADKLSHLEALFDSSCDHAKAMKCWGLFFETTYFDRRCADQKGSADGTKVAATISGATAVKLGGGRYA